MKSSPKKPGKSKLKKIIKAFLLIGVIFSIGVWAAVTFFHAKEILLYLIIYYVMWIVIPGGIVLLAIEVDERRKKP